jgi:hypothetical protein
MASIISGIMNSMSADDKAKLGRSGTKINTDGAHKLTIMEAYEITSEGGKYPRFVLKMEDGEGKSVDWTGFLKSTVGKDEKTKAVKAGEYSVNGVKVYLDKEGDEYDNLKVIGQIKNLWAIVGNDVAQFGAGIKPGTVTFPDKGIQNIDSWTALIGKQFTGVTSYLISLDAAGTKAWRNQDINMYELFTVDGLSQAEKDANKTEGTALEVAVTKAKAAASIKFKDKANKLCLQELQLVKGAGTVPVTETVTASAGNPF